MGNILDFNDLFEKIIWKIKNLKIFTLFWAILGRFLKKINKFLRFGKNTFPHFIWDLLNFWCWKWVCSIPNMFSKDCVRRFWKFSFFVARLLSFHAISAKIGHFVPFCAKTEQSRSEKLKFLKSLHAIFREHVWYATYLFSASEVQYIPQEVGKRVLAKKRKNLLIF